MSKGIAFLMITLVLWAQPLSESIKEEALQQIPDDAIRLRILANSDAEEDQQLKRQVRDEVNNYIDSLVANITDIEDAREAIRQNVPTLETIVETTIEQEGFELDYTVEYQSDVAFPTKKYGDYIYPAGEYEAVLITIGKGEGANWWCVLFPPLCFLDFSNGTTVADTEAEADEEATDEVGVTEALDEPEEDEQAIDAEDDEDVEVKFFLLEWLGLS